MSETDPPSSTAPSMVELLELLGRRWALRILWELREGPAAFQALQARCDSMSPSVLSQRLAELREAGLIEDSGRRATSWPTRAPGSLRGSTGWTGGPNNGLAHG